MTCHSSQGPYRKLYQSSTDSALNNVHTHNILWISGSPGAGKSAIASSLESRLRGERRFGSSFFFKRGDAVLSDPAALWRTVASDLAPKYPAVAEKLIENLQNDKVDPGKPDIELHFRCMIEEPLTSMCTSAVEGGTHQLVIILDALDECGTDSSQSPQRVKDF